MDIKYILNLSGPKVGVDIYDQTIPIITKIGCIEKIHLINENAFFCEFTSEVNFIDLDTYFYVELFDKVNVILFCKFGDDVKLKINAEITDDISSISIEDENYVRDLLKFAFNESKLSTLDELLDKIRLNGLDSLNDSEKNLLQEYSQQAL